MTGSKRLPTQDEVNRLYTAILHGVGAVVHSYTIPIVHRDRSDLGTGVGVEFEGLQLILTAGHVVKDLTDDEIFMVPRPDVPVSIGPVQPFSAAGRRRYGSRVQPRIINRIYAGDNDLAVLRIEKTPELKTLEFYPLSADAATPTVDTKVLVMGYPAEHVLGVRLPEGKGAMVVPLIQLSITLDSTPHADAPGFDPERHFLIEFKESSPSPTGTKTTSPAGLSGAGVWTAPGWEGVLWDPRDVGLAGIQTHWYRKRLIQRIVRVEVAVRFLSKAVAQINAS